MACKSLYRKPSEYSQIYCSLERESWLYECATENLGEKLWNLLTFKQAGAAQGHGLLRYLHRAFQHPACHCSVVVIFHYTGDKQHLVFISNNIILYRYWYFVFVVVDVVVVVIISWTISFLGYENMSVGKIQPSRIQYGAVSQKIPSSFTLLFGLKISHNHNH